MTPAGAHGSAGNDPQRSAVPPRGTPARFSERQSPAISVLFRCEIRRKNQLAKQNRVG
jgi:hypothetical protein